MVRFGLSVCMIGVLSSCVTQVDLGEVVMAHVEKSRGPSPESEWNAVGVWQRVPGDGPLYIPRGYPKSAARGEKEGAWVVDQRDGKRLFVPHYGVPGCSQAVLMAEAKKVTNWQPRSLVSTVPGVMIL